MKPVQTFEAQAKRRSPYVWDYDLDQDEFVAILNGQKTKGRLNQDWAVIRLLEYAPYPEIIRLLGFHRIVRGWPTWRGRVRSVSRRRAFDFLAEWLPKNHPELL